ncbi:hypothetical protein JW964_25795 [candidate division KSB1 bacterium]|nr:hypothetical protein [candidate division KSB1 bacterium]
MKYRRYYENVISGTNLFKFNRFNYTEYGRWIKDCTEWLKNDEVEPIAIAEWVTLDNDGAKPDASKNQIQPPEAGATLIVEGAKAKPIAQRQACGNETDTKDYKQLLDKISRRYLWLAKFPSGKLPSKDEKLLAKLGKKISSPKAKINLLIDMGTTCLYPTNSNTTHEGFHLWLRTTADFFQIMVPDSGVSAEWLSLPTITTFVDRGIIGGFEIQKDLIMALKERFIWIGKICNINISNELKQIDEMARRFARKGFAIPCGTNGFGIEFPSIII